VNVIIAGSRYYTNYDAVCAVIACFPYTIDTVVSGVCRGVDACGEQWARLHNKQLLAMPADWKTLGRKAGPIRNEYMVEAASGLILIWNGRSKGSADILKRAINHDLLVHIYNYETGQYSTS